MRTLMKRQHAAANMLDVHGKPGGLRRASAGFSLLEVTFVMAIFVVVTGAIFSMAISFSDTADAQDIKANANDAARNMYLNLVPELRCAQRSSINWNQLPGKTLTFRKPVDADGNGTAVNQSGSLELSDVITVGPDLTDVNGDGITGHQLVRHGAGDTQVWSNALASGAQVTNPDGTTVTVDGILFRPFGAGIEIIMVTAAQDRRGRTLTNTYRQIVTPRN
jgi:type II secretory pathway pseudopilin PulG